MTGIYLSILYYFVLFYPILHIPSRVFNPLLLHQGRLTITASVEAVVLEVVPELDILALEIALLVGDEDPADDRTHDAER